MKREPSGTEALLLVIGAVVLIGAIGYGYWWVARHMCWWTFGLTFLGVCIGQEVIKRIWKAVR